MSPRTDCTGQPRKHGIHRLRSSGKHVSSSMTSAASAFRNPAPAFLSHLLSWYVQATDDAGGQPTTWQATNLGGTLISALRAEHCYLENVDYVVLDGQVMLLNSKTGRLRDGMRLEDTMHQVGHWPAADGCACWCAHCSTVGAKRYSLVVLWSLLRLVP